ncbi:hypothetical protein RC74_10945 [Falsihalocynthiibacter arcticus]|uniref:Uncharacterized protein n=2 Tax=Falsihalocynthiibacter arcticus TaxID=1579316 RepID=A0A126V1Z6_9RHOB|nr:hypothetical protein RC74_10945 [Falsihalocynthiibacter arcticus]
MIALDTAAGGILARITRRAAEVIGHGPKTEKYFIVKAIAPEGVGRLWIHGEVELSICCFSHTVLCFQSAAF